MDMKWNGKIDTEAEKLFGKWKRSVLLFRLLLTAVWVFTIFLIFAGCFGKNREEFEAFSLLLGFVILMFGLMMAGSYGENGRRMRAWEHSPETMHDYYLLHQQAAKKKTLKDNYLFIMAKCSIYSGNLARAGEELNQVNYYGLLPMSQATYHFLWALIHRFGGQQEEFAHNVEIYRQMVQAQGKGLPRGEERLRALTEGSDSQLRELLNLGGDLKQNGQRLFWGSLAGFFTAALVYFVVGKDLLPQGLAFRNWFLILACGLLQIASFVSALLWLIKMNAVRRQMSAGIVFRVLGSIVLILMVFLFLLSDFAGMISLPSEKALPSGKILVTEENASGITEYGTYETWGLVMRRFLYRSDSLGQHLSGKAGSVDEGQSQEQQGQLWEEDQTQEQGGEQEQQAGQTDPSEAEQAPGDWNGGYTGAVTDEIKAQVYWRIYGAQFSDVSGGIQLQTSAKGELYALVGEQYDSEYMGEATKAQRRLVYDRLSENGECYEVAYYEDHCRPGESQIFTTTIEDIYAVVIETGQVIPSGRTGWADVGNDAYRAATGE